MKQQIFVKLFGCYYILLYLCIVIFIIDNTVMKHFKSSIFAFATMAILISACSGNKSASADEQINQLVSAQEALYEGNFEKASALLNEVKGNPADSTVTEYCNILSQSINMLQTVDKNGMFYKMNTQKFDVADADDALSLLKALSPAIGYDWIDRAIQGGEDKNVSVEKDETGKWIALTKENEESTERIEIDCWKALTGETLVNFHLNSIGKDGKSSFSKSFILDEKTRQLKPLTFKDPTNEASVRSSVREIYNEMCRCYNNDNSDEFNANTLFTSKEYQELEQKVTEKAQATYDIPFDCDPWINAQDWSDLSIKSIEMKEVDENKAIVDVSIWNLGATRTIRLGLVLEDNQWKVDTFIDSENEGFDLKKAMAEYINEQ